MIRSQAIWPVAMLGMLLAGGPSRSQESDQAASDTSVRTLIGDRTRYFQDFKGFMSSPAHWTGREWAQLGGVLAATSVVYQYDYDIRDHFVTDPHPVDYHDVEDVIPAAIVLGATWMTAKRRNDSERFEEAVNMVRASALSTVTSLVFKLSLGRERPGPGVERDRWWDGGRSMPSGHTALGFAVGTVFAESGNPKRRWVRRVVGYGLLGFGTAYLRLEHDSHWASDTVPGAALGIAAGRYTMSHDDPSARRADVFVSPMDGGAMLTFAFDLY